jgi:hypothetical protein
MRDRLIVGDAVGGRGSDRFSSPVSERSPEFGACSAPDRLRWIADFLDLGDKAISVIACVQGLDYPPKLHQGAQADLRAWAAWLDARPELAADLDMARCGPSSQ